MSNNNLTGENAIKKIKDIAEEVDIAMFCTMLGNKPFNTCPMSTKQIESDGTIWFLSGKDSDHNKDIKEDKSCQLIYSSKAGQVDHLSLYGEAEIVFDRDKAKELFSPMDKAWFSGGVDDPNFSMIKFSPQTGYYWDTERGKMVNFFKLVAATVTDEVKADGVSGSLDPK